MHLSTSWCAFGAPRTAVYFPVFLDGEVPETFTYTGQHASAESFWWRLSQLYEQLQQNPEQQAEVRESFVRLQARLDREAEEFSSEGAALKQRGALSDLQRQATLFMQYNLERFEAVLAEALHTRSLAAVHH
jgi:dipeptidase